jgi:TatD DNase family protein
VIFVDTHCHLNLEQYSVDIMEVVQRAFDSGVERILVPGINIESSIKAVEIASTCKSVYAAVGIHPNEVRTGVNFSFGVLEQLLIEKKVVAVGEIGLDYYHHPDTRLEQIALLKEMLEMAQKFDKPVILHSRNSIIDLLGILPSFITPKPNSKSGVIHSFEGNSEDARVSQEIGLFIGIGGALTYKNNYIKQKLVESVGIDNILLETDSPFLTPHPFRGNRNEPFRIPLIAQKISDILSIPLEVVASQTSKNAELLFNWDRAN